MMNKLLILIAIGGFTCFYAQIGVGTQTPEGALHIQNSASGTLGMVIPRVSTAESTVGVSQSAPVEGTMVYDNNGQCVRVRISATQWSACILEKSAVAGRSAR